MLAIHIPTYLSGCLYIAFILTNNGLTKWQGTSGGMAAGQILPEKLFPTEEHGSRGFRDVCEGEHGWSSFSKKD